MKNLLYYVCYGDVQRPLLRISIETVRTLGKYDGDIIIFSDKKISIPGCENRIVESVVGWEKMSIGRVYLGLTIKGDYDNIGYLDNDVVAQKPIDSFFQNTDKFRVPFGWISLPIDNAFDWPLSKEEETKAFQFKNVCSGSYVSNPDTFYKSLEIWKRVFESAPYKDNWKWKEQSALNMAIVRGELEVNTIPQKIVSIFSTHDPCLLHYCGTRGKRAMLRDWGKH